MCHAATVIEGKGSGISGRLVAVIENSLHQGQCSRCLGAIYPGMLCGIENGNLVCGSRVREKKLEELSYGSNVLEALQRIKAAHEECVRGKCTPLFV